MRAGIFVGTLFTATFVLLQCAEEVPTHEYATFHEIELELNSLVAIEAYREALTLLESATARFPDHDYEIQSHARSLYARLGDYETSLEVWERGLEKGYYFGINAQWEDYEPFQRYERFEFVAKENERLRDAAIRQSKSKVKVVLPNKRSGGRLPLLLALHGSGSTMEFAAKNWRSKKLESGFIVAYVQSYLHYGMKSFGWRRHDPRAREDIQELFAQIVEEYPVDLDRVVIGGLSAGGGMAIDVSVNEVVPTAGFIGVCPNKPEEFDRIKVRAAREQGVRGVIVSGEGDFYLPLQKEMVQLFNEEHFPHEFFILPELGHSYPDEFPHLIDRAIEYILREHGNSRELTAFR
jgi:predicted esterase